MKTIDIVVFDTYDEVVCYLEGLKMLVDNSNKIKIEIDILTGTHQFCVEVKR